MNWLMLLHQIPPAPGYLRAKVMKRLNNLGALPVKNSVYLLPASDDALEDFEWLKREIQQGGGEAWIFHCDPAGGLSDDSLRDSFRNLRAADFQALAEEGRAILDSPDPQRFEKLKQKHEEVSRIDFFGAPGRKEVEAMMSQIERVLNTPPAAAEHKEFKGCTWVTRHGVKVDRIASAWLIRRFLDPAAKFRFVDPKAYQHTDREIRFDMFEGEFTHQGDLCTFEVLLRTLDREDARLAAIAEVVHDIDLKDHKFNRLETPGIDILIQGIAARHADDTLRIEAGATLFDALYAKRD
jgi:hypothetical protein